MSNTKKMVLLSLFTAGAIVLSIIESAFPVPLPVYGVKLGLANIITLVVLYFFGIREALTVVCVRVLLTSIFGGGFVVFLFSITGGILSTLIMGLLLKYLAGKLSLWTISVSGSITHNMGQLMVAAIVMQDFAVMGYLPVLLVSGVIMGIFIGIVSHFLINTLKNINVFNMRQ